MCRTLLAYFVLATTTCTTTAVKHKQIAPVQSDASYTAASTARDEKRSIPRKEPETTAATGTPASLIKKKISQGAIPTKYELTAGSTLVKRIFLRRMRKAGSTTVFGFLLAVIKESSNYHKTGSSNITFDRIEYSSLNVGCLTGSAPLLTRSFGTVFLVTHLREPLSRINSEYWFAGPGKKVGIANETLWADWMAASRPLPGGGAPRIQTMGAAFNAGIYYDNYYTRMLTGACGECVAGAKLNLATGFGPVTGCSSHTKAFPFLEVTRERLQLAIELLEHSFDAVLILEWYSRHSMNAWLQATLERQLGVPRGAFKDHTLGHMRVGGHKDKEHATEEVRRMAICSLLS